MGITDMALTRRSLRSMRDRWQADLDRIEEAFPDADLVTDNDSVSETIRNLATAVAHIDGIITNRRIFPKEERY